MTSQIILVKNFLTSNHMFVDDEWLAGCVEYLTENSERVNSDNEIQALAKEQWLLNDLRDICPGSLPNNIKELPKTILNGKYVLQINAAIDIGTPAYQQYLKLQKVNMENVEATVRFEDKVPSHRMIKLHLTDGVQEITAIEYKPMRNLSCDITPGCKVLIKGPVECRRGMLLLTESCIELLGGEVQEIATSNSLAGLLSAKLGVQVIQGTSEQDSTSAIQPRNTNVPTLHDRLPVDGQTFEPTPEQAARPIARVTGVPVADHFVDDEIDVDELAAIEEQIRDNPVKRQSTDDISKPEKRIKIDPITRVNRADDYPDDCDLMFFDDEYMGEEVRFEARENDIKGSKNKGPITVSSEPFIYIKQINDMRENDRAGRVFKVKGQIMKLLSKLSVGKDGWSLRCTIVDGTGCLDVEFTSDVLSKLVGYTPQEMNQLKKQMATKPELKEKAILALQRAKDSLQVLYCIIELTVLEVPKITGLTPFGESHVDMIVNRLNSSNL